MVPDRWYLEVFVWNGSRPLISGGFCLEWFQGVDIRMFVWNDSRVLMSGGVWRRFVWNDSRLLKEGSFFDTADVRRHLFGMAPGH